MKHYGWITIASVIWFFVSVLVLGFVQPRYSHTFDTISVLAIGKWGFVQRINFAVITVGILALGMGLGIAFTGRKRSPLTLLFVVASIFMILVNMFPSDPVDRYTRNLTMSHSIHGAIHFISTAFLIIFTLPLVLYVVHLMKKNIYFKKYVRYTYVVFAINISFGIMWLVCRRFGILFEWKGLWQKFIVLNVLTWMFVMAKRLISLPSGKK